MKLLELFKQYATTKVAEAVVLLLAATSSCLVFHPCRFVGLLAFSVLAFSVVLYEPPKNAILRVHNVSQWPNLCQSG